MKKPTRIVLIALILCAGSGLAFWWLLTQPVARFSLPDGTELRLEYVTYGSTHRVPREGKLKAWLSRQARRWWKSTVPLLTENYEYGTAEGTICAWFTHYDRHSGKFLPITYEALRLMPVDDANGQQTVYAVSHHPWSHNPQKNAAPMPHATFCVALYDRRKPTVPLRASMQGQTYEMEIPNPMAKISFPHWQPEPLPQTRTIGELEIVMDSISADYGSNGEVRVRPSLEILRGGQKVAGVTMNGVRMEDATGNRGDSNSPLMFSEKAWKVWVSATRTEQYAFAEKDGESMGPVSMPGVGEFRLLQFSGEEKAMGLLVTALLGPGCYVMNGRTLEKAGKPLGEAEAEAFLAAPAAGTMRIHLEKAAFVRLYDQPARSRFIYGKPQSGFPEIVWRCRWQGEAHGLREYTSPLVVSQVHGSPFFPEVYEFPDSNGQGKAIALPRPGKPVTIQRIPVKIETVEFLVAPPARPAPSKGK